MVWHRFHPVPCGTPWPPSTVGSELHGKSEEVCAFGKVCGILTGALPVCLGLLDDDDDVDYCQRSGGGWSSPTTPGLVMEKGTRRHGSPEVVMVTFGLDWHGACTKTITRNVSSAGDDGYDDVDWSLRLGNGRMG